MRIKAIRTASLLACHSTHLRQLVSKLHHLAEGHQQTAPPADVSSEQLYPPPQVGRVDDPYGEMSIVAVRGDVQHDTIGQLEHVLADLPNGRFVHLDLANATIRTNWAMRLLEAIADDLERRGIVLRVVGLDPQHPMLTPTL